VNTRVDEPILDDKGRVGFVKMRPIAHGSACRTYRVVGEGVGGAWDAGMELMEARGEFTDITLLGEGRRAGGVFPAYGRLAQPNLSLYIEKLSRGKPFS